MTGYEHPLFMESLKTQLVEALGLNGKIKHSTQLLPLQKRHRKQDILTWEMFKGNDKTSSCLEEANQPTQPTTCADNTPAPIPAVELNKTRDSTSVATVVDMGLSEEHTHTIENMIRTNSGQSFPTLSSFLETIALCAPRKNKSTSSEYATRMKQYKGIFKCFPKSLRQRQYFIKDLTRSQQKEHIGRLLTMVQYEFGSVVAFLGSLANTRDGKEAFATIFSKWHRSQQTPYSNPAALTSLVGKIVREQEKHLEVRLFSAGGTYGLGLSHLRWNRMRRALQNQENGSKQLEKVTLQCLPQIGKVPLIHLPSARKVNKRLRENECEVGPNTDITDLEILEGTKLCNIGSPTNIPNMWFFEETQPLSPPQYPSTLSPLSPEDTLYTFLNKLE